MQPQSGGLRPFSHSPMLRPRASPPATRATATGCPSWCCCSWVLPDQPPPQHATAAGAVVVGAHICRRRGYVSVVWMWMWMQTDLGSATQLTSTRVFCGKGTAGFGRLGLQCWMWLRCTATGFISSRCKRGTGLYTCWMHPQQPTQLYGGRPFFLVGGWRKAFEWRWTFYGSIGLRQSARLFLHPYFSWLPRLINRCPRCKRRARNRRAD
jgi:hypothetical protein